MQSAKGISLDSQDRRQAEIKGYLLGVLYRCVTLCGARVGSFNYFRGFIKEEKRQSKSSTSTYLSLINYVNNYINGN